MKSTLLRDVVWWYGSGVNLVDAVVVVERAEEEVAVITW